MPLHLQDHATIGRLVRRQFKHSYLAWQVDWSEDGLARGSPCSKNGMWHWEVSYQVKRELACDSIMAVQGRRGKEGPSRSRDSEQKDRVLDILDLAATCRQ